MLKITRHAAIRFLERIIGMSVYTKQDLKRAYDFLQAETKNIVVRSYNSRFSLPSFKGYVAVVVENYLVTIIPKS